MDVQAGSAGDGARQELAFSVWLAVSKGLYRSLSSARFFVNCD